MGKIELPNINPNMITKKGALLPKYGGVYAFYSKEGFLLYIGKTNNFRQRTYFHNYGKIKNLIKYIELYRIDDELDRDIYESFLINCWKPLFNDKKTWKYKSYYNQIDNVIDINDFHLEGMRILDVSQIRISKMVEKQYGRPKKGFKENPVKTKDKFISLVADFIYPSSSKDKSDIRRFLNEHGYKVNKENQHLFFKKLIEYGFKETKMSIRLPGE